MRNRCFVLLCLLLLVPAMAAAAPSVSGVSGTIQDGQSVTVAGSGFGSKSTAAPVLWDNFEDGNFTGWSFVGGGSSWQMSSSPARGSYSAHKTNAAATDRMQIYPATGQSFYYTSFWFQPASNYSGNGNDKPLRMGESGGQSNLIFGRDYDTVETTPCSQYDTQVVYRGTSITAIRGQWNFVEVWADVAGDTATIALNGSILSQFPRSGCSTVWSAWDNTPYMAYGAWFGTSGIQGGWYFDDIYIDYSPARVMVCEGSSWNSRGKCEMQLPTAWSASSISATVNRGAFAADANAYLFVVDASGSASTGYLITFGDEIEEPPGGEDTTPPVLTGGYPSGELTYGTTSTTMGLASDEPATCRWSTTAGVAYSSMTNTFASTGGDSHSQVVSGLVDGGSYARYVRCADAEGNHNTSDYVIAWTVAEAPQEPPEPGVFSWQYSQYDIPRANGAGYFTILRTGGSSGAVSVDWSTSGQTAQHNVDYYGASNVTVNFADGETGKSIEVYGNEGITFIQNGATEDRYFHLILSNAQGGAQIGAPNTATVNIVAPASKLTPIGHPNGLRVVEISGGLGIQ